MIHTYISMFLFAIISIFLTIGAYVWTLNPKSTLNRVFLGMCSTLAIWAATLAIASASKNYYDMLFWRQMGAFGWGIFFSFFLHFSITLHNHTRCSKGTLVAIYLPAVINVLAFGPFLPSADHTYHFVYSIYGWVSQSTTTLWDLYFNLYYMLSTLLALIHVFLWGKESEGGANRRISYVFIISFLSAFALGSLTDRLSIWLLNAYLPTLSPVFSLGSVLVIYYIVRHKDLMHNPDVEPEENAGEILNQRNRRELFYYLAGIYLVAGYTNLLHYHFEPWKLPSIYLYSITFFVGSTLFIMLPHTPWSRQRQENIMALLMAFTIPGLQLRFLHHQLAHSTWATIILFLLFTVLMKRRELFQMVVGMAVLTHLAAWYFSTVMAYNVSHMTFLVRLGIILLVAFITDYVNRIYILRLREHESQMQGQRILSDLSTQAISIGTEDLQVAIVEMLKQVSTHLGAHLGSYIPDRSQSRVYYWADHQNAGVRAFLEAEGPMRACDWLARFSDEAGCVQVPDLRSLKHSFSDADHLLTDAGVYGLLSVPVVTAYSEQGYLTFYVFDHPAVCGNAHFEMVRLVGNILSDVLKRLAGEKEIHHLAYYDALTGLPNRAYFKQQLSQAIVQAKPGEKLAVMLLDLDSFKSLNDTLGHESGDVLLTTVARALRRQLDDSIFISRFGGDEFLIFFEGLTDTHDIDPLAAQVMRTFDAPLEQDGEFYYTTASAGIAFYPEDGSNEDSLVTGADLAMYEAKSRGKNQYVLCGDMLRAALEQSAFLTNSLYRALEREELYLVYQPQVSLRTGGIIGFEALIRWRHPEQGVISPAVFIPLAEQTGLIHSIGQWILKEAVTTIKKWRRAYDPGLSIAVNLSVVQFKGHGIVKVVADALEMDGLAPGALELEITETIAIEESDHLIELLNALKALGVQISIDDFGTGYSSLSRIKDLPIDRIKIAMPFVQGIGQSSKDEAIIPVLTHLARGLDMRIVAEGVETAAQVDFLRENGCDEIQGYYFYKPMLSEEIETLLSSKISIESGT